MKYLQDISYTDIDKGIEYLNKNKLNFYLDDEEIIIYHVYWYGNITRKQILCINSYLATQDLSCTKLWVWLDHNTFTEKNQKLIPKHDNIIVKKYIPKQEAIGTLFENNKWINETNKLKFRSDLARVIFLYKYGGLYFDLDMVLLKDMKPLLGVEFCYTWANLKHGNNGILRYFKESANILKLMQKYNSVLKKQKFYISFNRLIFTDELDIYCFPSVMFDPVWILFDNKLQSKYSKLNNFDDFFKTTDEDISKFFNNNIFAYHWHSRNNYKIEKASYFEKIENLFKYSFESL